MALARTVAWGREAGREKDKRGKEKGGLEKGQGK